MSVLKGTAPSKGPSDMYIFVTGVQCDWVAVWNVFLTEDCGQKVKTNKQKLWSGGWDVVYLGSSDCPGSSCFWPVNSWGDLYTLYSSLGFFGGNYLIWLFFFFWPKQMEILIWNFPQDADAWRLLEWLTLFCLKKQQYLAPGNEDLGARSRRGRWRMRHSWGVMGGRGESCRLLKYQSPSSICWIFFWTKVPA